MSKTKKILLAIVSVFTLGLAVGCTPEQVAHFNSLPVAEQNAVIAQIQAAQAASTSSDCYQAIDKHWPGDKARARSIVWRESRNQPAAANSRSSARGCFQMLSMHNHRYTAVGCSPAQWSNADCNVRAAAHLYRQAGWSPWNL